MRGFFGCTFRMTAWDCKIEGMASQTTGVETPAVRTIKAVKPSSKGTRRMKAVTRKLRELGSIGSALASTGHPYMAHIVPMRRCNLACTYCNEFDDVSDPVPIEEMERRIDELGRLGTSVIT